MYKFIMVTNYKVIEQTKYGKCKLINGLLYNNIDSNVIGRQNYTIWAYPNNPIYDIIKPDSIGKDLYLEFGPNGHINKADIKQG